MGQSSTHSDAQSSPQPADNLNEREYAVIAQLGSYSKKNLYDFLHKYIPDATRAMQMSTVLDIWHRDCLRHVDKVTSQPPQTESQE